MPKYVHGGGETYDVEKLRAALIERRDTLFEAWPEAISDTVLLSHTILVLSYVLEMD